MSDDLAEIQRQLDELYLAAVNRPVQRRPQLVAAAMQVIHAAAVADAQLERAFGHLAPAGPALPLQEARHPLPPMPHEGHQMPAASGNPALEAALRRDGT